MITKQAILEFLDKKLLLVLSTVNEQGLPESAVVGFGQTSELELICGTSKHSRKAQNIENNENVSAVIGWDDQGTIQYEGKARILSGDEASKYAESYFKKNPKARQYKHDPDEIFILISPRWLRFTQLTTIPWKVTELDF